MPYGGDPENSASDQLRLLIGDTSTGSPALSDAEVTYFINTHPNIYLAASYAVEAILANEGGSISEKQVGDLKIRYESAGGSGGLTGLAASLRRRAVRYKGTMFLGGSSVADVESREDDSDRTSPSFQVGQMDNPSALKPGRADYDPAVVDWAD